MPGPFLLGALMSLPLSLEQSSSKLLTPSALVGAKTPFSSSLRRLEGVELS